METSIAEEEGGGGGGKANTIPDLGYVLSIVHLNSNSKWKCLFREPTKKVSFREKSKFDDPDPLHLYKCVWLHYTSAVVLLLTAHNCVSVCGSIILLQY